MKTKFGIVGCGFLGNIVANAWKNGLLEDYELVGVTSRSPESAQKAAEAVGCTVCADVDALLALDPEYIVETASVEAVREMAIPVLKRGVNLVVIPSARLPIWRSMSRSGRPRARAAQRCIWPAAQSAALTCCKPSA